MPLLQSPRARIILDVADRTQADTRIRQRAQLQSLFYHQSDAGESVVVITVQVSLFAAAGDGFGPLLTGPGFASYPVELTADNQTVVDAETGAILATRRGEDETQWQAQLAAYAQPVMLQGDFFEYLRDNQPVLLGAMLRQHIAQADAMGRFA